MSNKTELQSNNTDLQALINKANSLETINNVEQATPSITVNSSGLITATATQSAGRVSDGTKSATKQLTTQGAQTITPSTSNKTIASGIYLTGTQTIKGDANLKAANIASGVSIFGVTGTHSGSEDLSAELTTQDSLISQIQTALQGKAAGGGGGGIYVVGEIKSNSTLSVPSGQNICSVTGLPFKPTHVIIIFDGSSNYSTSSTSYYTPVFIENGLRSNSVYARKYSTSYTYLYPTLSYSTLTLTNDGFVWTSNNSNLYVPFSLGYSYIAFGGDMTFAGTYDATEVYSSGASSGGVSN